jgi:hypothetical protein
MGPDEQEEQDRRTWSRKDSEQERVEMSRAGSDVPARQVLKYFANPAK